MSLTDDSNMVMPVSPMGNGNANGFGGDWGSWIILFLIFGMFSGNWGGFGGAVNGAMGYDFPWLMNGQQGINNNVSDGFRDAQLHDSVTSVRDGISQLSTQLCGCCGDTQMALANGFAGVNANLCNGFNGVTGAINNAQNALAQQLYTNQLADLNRSFDSQTAITQGMNSIAMNQQNCCCENRAGVADLKYTVATENCADRAALSDGLRDVIANQTSNTQRILDKLCDQELQAERRENQNLRSELMYARGQASQVDQTAQIRAGQNATMSALVNELRSCPIPSQPVYGSQPIFTCPQNATGCGCGCGM